MAAKIDYVNAAPEAFRAVVALETYVSTKSNLDKRLIHLIKLRASQINGCAYCVDMHTKEARNSGLSEQWIALVCVWREALIFEPRERAVLAWTEALTKLDTGFQPEKELAELKQFFSDEEITNLSVAACTINVWNRLAVGFSQEHPID